MHDVPFLDVVAARSADGQRLLLFCVNRELAKPLTATLDLAKVGSLAGPATITMVSAESLLTENDEASPNRIQAATRTEEFPSNRKLTFPAASVSVVEIPLHFR